MSSMFPAFPPFALPVDKRSAPDAPTLVDPEAKESDPDTPFVPASLVFNVIEPEVVFDDAPDAITIEPPVRILPTPAFTATDPP